MTDTDLRACECAATVVGNAGFVVAAYHMRALVAEVRRLRNATAGAPAMIEELCEMRGERFARANPPGNVTA